MQRLPNLLPALDRRRPLRRGELGAASGIGAGRAPAPERRRQSSTPGAAARLTLLQSSVFANLLHHRQRGSARRKPALRHLPGSGLLGLLFAALANTRMDIGHQRLGGLESQVRRLRSVRHDGEQEGFRVFALRTLDREQLWRPSASFRRVFVGYGGHI